MPILETSVIDTFLYTTLTNDPTITGIIGTRCYADFAPQGTIFPNIIFQLQAATDLNAVSSQRVYINSVYVVKAVVETASYGGTIATLAQRIDALLHRQQKAISNVGYIWCRREQPFRLAEVTDGGKQYRHMGGIYRIWAQAY